MNASLAVARTAVQVASSARRSASGPPSPNRAAASTTSAAQDGTAAAVASSSKRSVSSVRTSAPSRAHAAVRPVAGAASTVVPWSRPSRKTSCTRPDLITVDDRNLRHPERVAAVWMLRRALIPLVVLALAAPATAAARVIVIASGDANATFADVSSNRVINRSGVGGAARAVAIAPDGTRAFVRAGRQVVSFDLAKQAPAARATVNGVVGGLAISADGARLYVSRPGGLDIVDKTSFGRGGTVRLARRSRGGRVAVSPDGTRALVVLDTKTVELIDLVGFKLLKRIKITLATDVACGTRSTGWVSTDRGQ